MPHRVRVAPEQFDCTGVGVLHGLANPDLFSIIRTCGRTPLDPGEKFGSDTSPAPIRMHRCFSPPAWNLSVANEVIAITDDQCVEIRIESG